MHAGECRWCRRTALGPPLRNFGLLRFLHTAPNAISRSASASSSCCRAVALSSSACACAPADRHYAIAPAGAPAQPVQPHPLSCTSSCPCRTVWPDSNMRVMRRWSLPPLPPGWPPPARPRRHNCVPPAHAGRAPAPLNRRIGRRAFALSRGGTHRNGGGGECRQQRGNNEVSFHHVTVSS